MKIIIDRPALNRALHDVSPAVAVRSPKPQLGCFLLRATKTNAGGLEVIGTDGELSLRTSIAQIDVQQAGDCLIPADKLKAIVAAEDDEPTLTLEVTDDTLHIKGATAHFKVHGYQPSDFPTVPTFDDLLAAPTERSTDAPRTLTLNAHTLARLLDLTLFATAKENTRYAINGVMLKREGTRVDVCATDGRRLALARIKLAPAPKGTKASDIKSTIISSRAAAQIRRILATDANAPDVELAITDSHVHARQGATQLSANLVEGSFPPYEDVLPKTSDKTATLPREVFASAVRRAALLTNEESRGVRLAFKPDGQGRANLELSARAAEVGEAAVHMPTIGYDGEAIEIGFNPSFLNDACKHMDVDTLTFQLQAPNKPGLITNKPVSDADKSVQFSYVVMPVSLV